MLSKLFGKKKSKDATSLDEAAENLFETIREESQRKNLDKALQACLPFLEKSTEEEVDAFLNKTFDLSEEPEFKVAQISLAFMVCGYFVEKGYSATSIAPRMIHLLDSILDTSRPFFDLLAIKVKEGESGELEEDLDVDAIFNELLEDRSQVEFDTAKATVSLDQYYVSAISVFSSNIDIFNDAKDKLETRVIGIKEASNGAYWLSLLFETLFNEPIIVIDLDKRTGFAGKMSGISDNYQLQSLLMSLPELNETPTIAGELLGVVDGTGLQSLNETIVCKWNTYDIELCKQEDWQNKISTPEGSASLSDYWIWGEGLPTHISVHDGHRIILLGKPSYARSTRAQRTFKNLKASISVEKMLSSDEIDALLIAE